MDLNKIGKFISEERKKKNYTQKQLADILNVSDRTISKWECGKGFPEVSLLQPLCKALGISVNELLTGKRLDKENYMKKGRRKNGSSGRRKEREQNEINSDSVKGTYIHHFFCDADCCCKYICRSNKQSGERYIGVYCMCRFYGWFACADGGRTHIWIL